MLGYTTASQNRDDVIKWKHFPRLWSPVNSPHKGHWRGALMFSLIWVWINRWVNNREAGDLRCHHAHYDVTAMILPIFIMCDSRVKMNMLLSKTLMACHPLLNNALLFWQGQYFPKYLLQTSHKLPIFREYEVWYMVIDYLSFVNMKCGIWS